MFGIMNDLQSVPAGRWRAVPAGRKMAIVKSLGSEDGFAWAPGSRRESGRPRSAPHTDYGWKAAVESSQVIPFRKVTLPIAPKDSPDDPLDGRPGEPPLAA
jgi:hypothetical protein